MTDDLDLDSLLQAAEALVQQPKIGSSYEPVQYEQRHATIHCSFCNTTYTGSMTCVVGMENLYDNYSSKWCPKCIADQTVLWWSQCFRMSNVEEITNGLHSASDLQSV